MALDDPIVLSELIDVTDIRDIARSFAATHDVAIAVAEKPSKLLVSTAPDSPLRPVLDSASEAGASVTGPDGGASPGDAGESGGRPVLTRLEFDTGRYMIVPILHQGGSIGQLALSRQRPGDDSDIDPDELTRLGHHISRVFDILIHNAFARHVTAAVHNEAMAANFSELSAKNKRLEKAVERMQEAERLKSSFLATMSHELRTPLTSVIGYSEMMLEGLAGPVNKEQREYLKTILGKADQLLQLITGILDVSMLESGAPPLKREPLIIRMLVDSVLTSLGDMLKARRVSVTETVDNVPRVMADTRQLREVLRQLLANALKFTDSGDSIEIEIGVGALQPDSVTALGQSGVRIVVRDSGIGIAGEQQGNIFEPFFQVDSSSTRQYGGSGLGLTLAKRYIEAHGGRIWVDSVPGEGATFTIALPAVADDMRAFLDRDSES